MTADINLLLFDRFRLVGRQMRMGWAPEDLEVRSAQTGDQAKNGIGSSSVRLLKREAILTVLALYCRGMKQRDIADVMGVSPSTISEMVNHLVEDGYVERKDDPEDRRVKLLVLTEEGRRQADEIVKERLSILAHLFRRVDDQEKQELIRLLDRLLGR